MKKRQLTEEQQAARDQRRAGFRELAKKISKLNPEERAKLAAKMPALVTVAGHPLSAFNCCLVAYQFPNATIVGGFRQWIKAGRVVRKGQHGFSIYVPTGKKGDDTEPSEAETAESAGRPKFIAGTLFDVSQTDPLPDKSEPGEAEFSGFINSQAKTDPAHGEAIALELELGD